MVLLVAEELWLSHSEAWAEEYQQACMFLLVAQLDSAFELSFSSSIAFSELHLVVNKKYNTFHIGAHSCRVICLNYDAQFLCNAQYQTLKAPQEVLLSSSHLLLRPNRWSTRRQIALPEQPNLILSKGTHNTMGHAVVIE
jgi:hypothetical protein